jgi:hypothetical protein
MAQNYRATLAVFIFGEEVVCFVVGSSQMEL